MKVKPLGDRVLLRPLEPPERQTASGLTIPTPRAATHWSEVLDLGPEVDRDLLGVGDVVLTTPGVGDQVPTQESQELVLVGLQDVLAVQV